MDIFRCAPNIYMSYKLCKQYFYIIFVFSFHDEQAKSRIKEFRGPVKK